MKPPEKAGGLFGAAHQTDLLKLGYNIIPKTQFVLDQYPAYAELERAPISRLEAAYWLASAELWKKESQRFSREYSRTQDELYAEMAILLSDRARAVQNMVAKWKKGVRIECI